MNAFYHEFTPSIWGHAYPYIGIAMAVIALILGLRTYEKVWSAKRRRFVMKRVLKNIDKLIVFGAVVFAAMAMFESYHGILQSLDNGLAANESPAWSLIALPLVGLFIAAMAFGGLYAVYFAAVIAKRAMIISSLRKAKERRMVREAKLEREIRGIEREAREEIAAKEREEELVRRGKIIRFSDYRRASGEASLR